MKNNQSAYKLFNNLYVSLRRNCLKYVDYFVFGVIILQPILDVISYWAVQYDYTIFTTITRFVIFTLIMAYAWVVARDKKIYYVMFVIITLFWIVHSILLALRPYGYSAPIADLMMYFRTLHIPLLTVAFISIFKASVTAKNYALKAIAINVLIIAAIVLISYMTGSVNYAYEYAKQGIVGWFEVDNAQSALLAIITPLALLFAFLKNNIKLFILLAIVSAVLLISIGTKTAYYSIFITAALFILSFVVTKMRNPLYYVAILLFITMPVILYSHTPLYKSDNFHKEQMALRQRQLAKTNPIPKDVIDIAYNSKPSQADQDIYIKYLPNLVNKFGLSTVKVAYHSTIDINIITDRRVKTLKYANLLLATQPNFLIISGMEISDFTYNNEIFDLENDFTALYYIYGILGLILYLAIFIYIFTRMAIALVKKEITYINPELIILSGILILSIGIAELSASVLRRPSVAIYIAFVIAYLYVLTEIRSKSTQQKNDMKI